jgi:predicted RNA-binding protein associated with RNAse of E/G family
MPKFTATFEDTGDYWKIRINGELHMTISKEEFVAFRSYNNGIKSKAYYIDIVYKTIVDTATYKTKELWVEMLKVLDENVI